ncbi:hypothetical protein PR202_gb04103 [Eleusine coracana subsp. coracana]|uniref:Uncharacterized protein n=1 Tax=Eleusine coracana subsp. coracana TaxID=191504 RepID=A0AAV5E213_ELECO|nr:hypothetical protein PR202_gb04103 [Eleusine coracana subsp. coracana]
MDTENGSMHIVMVPWLAFGHILPFTELAKRIARQGHRVTLLSTPRNTSRQIRVSEDLAALVRAGARRGEHRPLLRRPAPAPPPRLRRRVFRQAVGHPAVVKAGLGALRLRHALGACRACSWACSAPRRSA